ncbi:MAG: hypothetical protein IKM49_03925 [Ruminococcus sp.]|nr:hypothetical protein [Ruminococcus sp.]
MKKKNIIMLMAMAVFTATTILVGCNKAVEENVSSGDPLFEGVTEASQSQGEENTEATNAQDASEENTSATESTTEPEEATDATEEVTQPDPEAPATEPAEEIIVPADADDNTVLSEAQKLFEMACDTEWKFHVGCPYKLDPTQYVTNNFGWEFYLVTDSGINSVADVEQDYYKVFSESYGNDLSELYMEKNGRVYALDGARGGDIYYTGSKITEIKSRTDTEIFFTVENYYSGDDFTGEGAYTEKTEFSAVIGKDGAWRAGEFTLPY